MNIEISRHLRSVLLALGGEPLVPELLLVVGDLDLTPDVVGKVHSAHQPVGGLKRSLGLDQGVKLLPVLDNDLLKLLGDFVVLDNVLIESVQPDQLLIQSFADLSSSLEISDLLGELDLGVIIGKNL